MAAQGADGDWPKDNGERKDRQDRCDCREPTDQILNTGELLLEGLIVDHVQNIPDVAGASLPGVSLTDQQRNDPSIKRLSECLRKIGDDLNRNTELQRIIERVQCNPPREVFFQVAQELFADGVFNWGRVVALFYFACKLVVQALYTKVPDMIRTIIGWTMDYLRVYVVQWIRDQGGWEGIFSYIGTPTYQAIGVFLAGVLTATFVIWKLS